MMVRPFYIPLVAPHSDLCLSHALPSDIPQKVNVLNDPSVYMSLIGPPYPSSVESVDWWESYEQDRWDKGEVLEAPCVIRKIAELESDSPTFLGTVTLMRSTFGHLTNPTQRADRSAANLVAPDGSKRWDVGFFMNPEFGGKGIMTSAAQTLINYARDVKGVPRRNIAVSAFSTNAASLRIQTKLGFIPRYLVRGGAKLAESKGGGERDVLYLFSSELEVGLPEEKEEGVELAQRI